MGTWIFSSLDQLSARGMRFALELEEQVRSNRCIRVINPPAKTLLRLPLLERLYREGLNRHHAAPAAAGSDGERGGAARAQGGETIHFLRTPR